MSVRRGRLAKMEIDLNPHQEASIDTLAGSKTSIINLLTSDASSSSMAMSLAMQALLPCQCLVARGDRPRWNAFFHLELHEIEQNKNAQNLSSLGRLTPWKRAGPVWMYGGLRSGCMECAAAGGCLSPRAPQLCVHPGPPQDRFSQTSWSRDDSRRNSDN